MIGGQTTLKTCWLRDPMKFTTTTPPICKFFVPVTVMVQVEFCTYLCQASEVQLQWVRLFEKELEQVRRQAEAYKDIIWLVWYRMVFYLVIEYTMTEDVVRGWVQFPTFSSQHWWTFNDFWRRMWLWCRPVDSLGQHLPVDASMIDAVFWKNYTLIYTLDTAAFS